MIPPRARTRRRWPIATLAAGLAVVVILAVAGGAARATADAAGTAADMAARGQYAASIAVDRQIAGRTGPLFLMDRSDVTDATLNGQRTMLAWARALAAGGQVDQAVALTRAVTDIRVAEAARDEEAALLLEAAKSDAGRADFASALVRLDQVAALNNPGVSAEVPPLRAQYLVQQSQALIAAGNGVDAVSALDTAGRLSAATAGSAAGLLPAALLAAGRQDIDAQYFADAAVQLQRLAANYPGSNEARIARGMLAAGQPVTGTLVDRAGQPLSAQVRLSSHFFTEPGGYLTTGPFYTTTSDTDGNFRFDSIPPGGPYVFEIFHNGNWMTFVDPHSGQPANPVNVAPLTPELLTFISIS